VAADYAVLLHEGSWSDAGLHAQADEFLVPLERVRTSTQSGSAPPTGRPLRVEGAVVSAVTRDAGGLVVRVFNPLATAVEVRVERDSTPATGWLIDLLGRPEERFQAAFQLRAAGIATVRLD
jgi:alpha-mannosidase